MPESLPGLINGNLFRVSSATPSDTLTARGPCCPWRVCEWTGPLRHYLRSLGSRVILRPLLRMTWSAQDDLCRHETSHCKVREEYEGMNMSCG